jgi:hypothetical protein
MRDVLRRQLLLSLEDEEKKNLSSLPRQLRQPHRGELEIAVQQGLHLLGVLLSRLVKQVKPAGDSRGADANVKVRLEAVCISCNRHAWVLAYEGLQPRRDEL